jgi:hypothetical protein
MFGAVPYDIIVEAAKMGGYMQQLSIETAPMFEIDIDCLETVFEKMSYITEYGYKTSYTKSEQHPSCKVLWDYLYKHGYVQQANYSNGDVVLKDFYINRYWFKEGERFLCSSALKFTIEQFMKTDEYQRRRGGGNEEDNQKKF